MSSDIVISFTYNTIDKGYIQNNFVEKGMIDKLLEAKDAQIKILQQELIDSKKQNSELLKIIASE